MVFNICRMVVELICYIFSDGNYVFTIIFNILFSKWYTSYSVFTGGSFGDFEGLLYEALIFPKVLRLYIF